MQSLLLQFLNYYKISMGTCATDNHKTNQKKIRKIEIHCPICEQSYDIDDHKPYIVCQNKHKLCYSCLTSIKNHANLKKREKFLCPFCKVQIDEDLITTDRGIYDFLDAQLETLRILPDNKKKLFAFTSIYLPSLHKLMKAQGGKSNKNGHFQSIEMLRIRGKMLEEYQTFQMEMLNCMIGLRKIYLNNNHIKAVDITAFSLKKIQLIDLSSNNITSIKNIMAQSHGIFTYLKVLILSNNLIEDAKDISKFQYLQIAHFSKNSFKSMQCFNECKSIKHLNLQFNKITQAKQFSPNFTNLCSLQLFGNELSAQSWQNFIKFPWRQLRFLTGSVNIPNLLEKYVIHNRIIKMETSPFLKLAVFQMNQDQPQNTNDVVQNINKQESFANKTRSIELTAETYQFYIDNKSFLRDIIQAVLRYHPHGINTNFKPCQMNKIVYAEDDYLFSYKKLNNSEDPADFLYSHQMTNEIKGKVFISFSSKLKNLVIGLRENAQSLNQISLDIDTWSMRHNKEEKPCNKYQNITKDIQQVEIGISFFLQEGYVAFIIAGSILQKYYLVQKWQEYRFFVHLKEKGGSIKIIRDQIEII